ncbi:hypothetical protein BSKO_10682 [Bryopsis sp. KO-2023]|nr:hypothetical protein BSKO_10682 [Bryopsis sp. KO-2023]
MPADSRPHVDDVLNEVEQHINRLDQCVAKLASQMQDTDACQDLKSLAGEALDANKNATILAELRTLLLDQRRAEGGDAHVPQAVLDLLMVGRASCEHHVQRLMGQ